MTHNLWVTTNARTCGQWIPKMISVTPRRDTDRFLENSSKYPARNSVLDEFSRNRSSLYPGNLPIRVKQGFQFWLSLDFYLSDSFSNIDFAFLYAISISVSIRRSTSSFFFSELVWRSIIRPLTWSPAEACIIICWAIFKAFHGFYIKRSNEVKMKSAKVVLNRCLVPMKMRDLTPKVKSEGRTVD